MVMRPTPVALAISLHLAMTVLKSVREPYLLASRVMTCFFVRFGRLKYFKSFGPLLSVEPDAASEAERLVGGD